MRKFWIAMLAVGLMMAFTLPAFAADVKFSGSLRMRGWYDDNITMSKDASLAAGANRGSQAFVDNRLRMFTDFKVAEGLVLSTRFDALERKWGQTLNYGYYAVNSVGGPSTQSALVNNQDSVSFERAFVDFTTGIGRFFVGYQPFVNWGTNFGDTDNTYPGVKYVGAFGPLTVIAAWEKRSESTLSPANRNMAYNAGLTDIDTDVYDLGAIYKFTGGETGLMWQYVDNRQLSSTQQTFATYPFPFKQKFHVINPYVKYKAGPVYVEAEGAYFTGKWREYDRGNATAAFAPATTPDVDLVAWGAYVKAEVDLKPAYVGIKFVYATGDDTGTPDKQEGGILTQLSLGQLHDFALMYGNYEYYNQITGLAGWTGNGRAAAISYGIDNAIAYQVYGGIKPTPKIDVKMAFTYATVEKKPVGYESDKIGMELDLVAAYKIFDNLTYQVGAGYFWTGDYFKGTVATAALDNDYLIMHQLMLSF